MVVSATSFLCLIARHLAEINGSLYSTGKQRRGTEEAITTPMCVKHFTVAAPPFALKVPLGSELQRTAFSKALI
jgi:hypothetical protein